METQPYTRAWRSAAGRPRPGQQSPAQKRPAASRAQAEEMLRDVAYVLHLTRRLKADIVAGNHCHDVVLLS